MAKDMEKKTAKSSGRKTGKKAMKAAKAEAKEVRAASKEEHAVMKATAKAKKATRTAKGAKATKVMKTAKTAAKTAKTAAKEGRVLATSSFVRIGEEMPPYDANASYSCENDPYHGRRKPVVVEFMALDLKVCDRCQGTDKRVEAAVEMCRPVLASCGYDIELKTAIVENEWMAEEHRFYSSPTIRVNGVDICPSIEENDCGCCSDMSDSPVKCRLYPFNGTYYEVPPVDLVVQGIMSVVVEGRSADPMEEPYELPENFAVFFEGVRRKKADKGGSSNEKDGTSGSSKGKSGSAGGKSGAEDASASSDGSEGSCCCGPNCC